MEMEPQATNAPGITGSTMAQDAQTMTFASPLVMAVTGRQSGEADSEDQNGYTEEELSITKRFIELIGGAERARELVDKVADCEDCLGIIDDNEAPQSDDSVIGRMADIMPDMPDLPSALYNPLGGQQPY